MKKKIVIFLSYIILFFNSNLLSDENDKKLKIGLLAPLTGEYAELGKSLLYSLQLALDEINDNDVFIIPRDTGFRNKTKLNLAIEEIRDEGVNIIIGPMKNLWMLKNTMILYLSRLLILLQNLKIILSV